MSRVTLFVGPSAHGVAPAALGPRGTTILPPARRGDIGRLVGSTARPGVVVLCDGIFHAQPAVSHAEICLALDAGWSVWGVSSMGAIRAFEMRNEGMHGFGFVYSQFARFTDFTDDEMSLLHFPEPPHFPVSEPLVNLRYAFDAHGAALGISRASADAVLGSLRELWFGERTLETMRETMRKRTGIGAGRADALLAWLQSHRIKTLDLLRLMAARPWRETISRRAPS